MKKTEIRRERRKAKSRRAVKAYWKQAFKEAYAQYLAADVEDYALYADDELIELIAGADHVNQYGLEVAREQSRRELDRCERAVYEAMRRYLVA